MDKSERIEEENRKYIEMFEKSLEGLSPKAIKRHVRNVERYLEDALWCEEKDVREATEFIMEFIGYRLIHKFYASKSEVREYLGSIKKFYKCMLNNEVIDKERFDDLMDTIKFNKDIWYEEADERSCELSDYF
ncbi:MAG: hypothetical protein ACI4WM_02835 [Erysipelotrichaceae bacterium]